MVVPPKRKSSRKRQKIYTWLRKRISGLDFGFKTDAGPRHSNTNSEVLDKLNGGRGWLDRVANRDMDDHFAGSRTYYFAGNGSGQFDETLAMIDIDCHRRGTPAGAMEFAEFLRTDPLFGDVLYVETSTNGVGIHGYISVVKGWASDRTTNVALKVLDLYLKVLTYLGDYDIELVEVKGMCPELTWGRERGRLEEYKSGTLAKLPREALRRAEELMCTSRIHVTRLLRLGLDIAEMAEAAGVPAEIVGRMREASEHLAGRRTWPVHLDQLREAVKDLEKWRLGRVSEPTAIPITSTSAARATGGKKARGSTEAPTVSDEIAGMIRGKLLRFAKNWIGARMAAGRRRVTPLDVVILIAILAHTKDNPNKDGSTPTAWIKLLWEDLYDRGYIDRPWDHHRFKAARDILSQMGWITWKDEKYVIGQEVNGEYRKGQAAKWEATDYLRSIASEDEEKIGEGGPQEEERGEGHIYGHSSIRINPLTIPDYLRDELIFWKSPQFAGYVGQPIRLAA